MASASPHRHLYLFGTGGFINIALAILRVEEPAILGGTRRAERAIVVAATRGIAPDVSRAGIAAAFVRRACEMCPVPWIETLSAMGQINPFFERAGFTRVGTIRKTRDSRQGAYGKRVSAETRSKSAHSEPVYYVFDNRGN